MRYEWVSMEILARVAARMGEPDRAIAAFRNYSRSRTLVCLKTYRLLRRCFGWIRCLIRSGMIRAFKSSSLRPDRSDLFCSFANRGLLQGYSSKPVASAQSAIVSIRIVSRSGFTPNSFTQRPSHRCSSRRRYWVHRCSSSAVLRASVVLPLAVLRASVLLPSGFPLPAVSRAWLLFPIGGAPRIGVPPIRGAPRIGFPPIGLPPIGLPPIGLPPIGLPPISPPRIGSSSPPFGAPRSRVSSHVF